MKVLALDVSYSCTGWSLVEGERGGKINSIIGLGSIEKKLSVVEHALTYPRSYALAARFAAGEIATLATSYLPIGALVIEETNPAGRGQGSRYTNKILEWLHHALYLALEQRILAGEVPAPEYISNNVWRRTLGLRMSDADRRHNELVRRALKIRKRDCRPLKEIAAEIGILGEPILIDRKGLSVRHANRAHGLSLKKSENDRAEAICIAEAYLAGAPLCDGAF